MNTRVLILGASGQAGPLLAHILLQSGATIACTSRFNAPRGFCGLAQLNIMPKVKKFVLDPTKFEDLKSVIQKWKPKMIFHFAGSASPSQSVGNPITSLDFAKTTLNLLEAVRLIDKSIIVRIASSGEIFKKIKGKLIDETSVYEAKCLYSNEKIAACNLITIYRDKYDLNCASLHLFNHESEIRSKEFVTAKIVHGAIDIAEGKSDLIQLGNLDIVRDWGWASEYMQALKLSAFQKQPEDYIISTGVSISLKRFIGVIFTELELDMTKYVVINEELIRVGEPQEIYTNPSKIRRELSWSPRIIGEEVPKKMLQEVLKLRSRNAR